MTENARCIGWSGCVADSERCWPNGRRACALGQPLRAMRSKGNWANLPHDVHLGETAGCPSREWPRGLFSIGPVAGSTEGHYQDTRTGPLC